MRLLFVFLDIDNEPHGVMRVSGLLKQHGHEVKMVVASHEDVIAAAREWRPDVLGFSVYTGTHRAYLSLNRELRSHLPEAISIFGGPHPTFFPEMVEEEGVDGVCVGEGEYATLDLLEVLGAGRDPSSVPNWHWKRSDGSITRNAVRPLLAGPDLDELPIADRDLVYDAHPATRRRKIRPFITGRGCPYNCSFCFNRAYSEIYDSGTPRVRRRSVDDVLEEISQVRDQYGLSFVMFLDDTFVVSKKWLREFAPKYRERIGLPWWAQARADLIDDERASLLREAGCVSVSFGIETGNDDLRNAVLNRNMSKEQILGASDTLRKHHIAFSTNNMVGLPMGGLQADLETLELNIACRPAYANCFVFQPYPKTALGEIAREQGLIDSFDDLSGSVTDDTPLRFDPAEKRQIENLQKLFSVTVEYPFLLAFVRRAIKWPRNSLFWLVYKLWKGYALKRRIFTYRMSLWETLANLYSFMRIRSQ